MSEEKIETISREQLISKLLKLPKTLDSLNGELIKKEIELLEIVALRKSAELRIKSSVVDAPVNKDAKRKTVKEQEIAIKNKFREDTEIKQRMTEEQEKKKEVNMVKNDIEFIKYSHRSLVAIAQIIDGNQTKSGGEDGTSTE